MKKLIIAVFGAAMAFGMTGCFDDSNNCSYYGTSGGCSSTIPYSCPESNQCSSSSTCSNIGC